MAYGCKEIVQLSRTRSVLLHGLLEDPLIVSPVRHQLWIATTLVMHATEVHEEQNSHPEVNETIADPCTGRGKCTEHVCVFRRIEVESSKRWFPGSCDSQCRKSFLASTVNWVSDTCASLKYYGRTPRRAQLSWRCVPPPACSRSVSRGSDIRR